MQYATWLAKYSATRMVCSREGRVPTLTAEESCNSRLCRFFPNGAYRMYFLMLGHHFDCSWAQISHAYLRQITASSADKRQQTFWAQEQCDCHDGQGNVDDPSEDHIAGYVHATQPP